MKYPDDYINKVINADCLEVMKQIPDNCIDCCITSPPYWGLRNYGVIGQYGLEKTPEEYTDKMVSVFREVRRILKPTATLWINLGDSYAHSGGTGWTGLESKNWKQKAQPRHLMSLKPKDLVGIPWRVAFALQKDGWYLRQDIIWHKPNPMPESVTDRCTKSHEYIFLMAKSQKYYFDNDAIREKRLTEEDRDDGIERDRRLGYNSKQKKMREYNELKKKVGSWATDTDKNKKLRMEIGFQAHTKKLSCSHPLGRNKRSVWTINTKPYREAHFATFPEKLVEPMIKAGCPVKGIVLDPFAGAGTTLKVAKDWGRKYTGVELNPKYIELIHKRLAQEMLI